MSDFATLRDELILRLRRAAPGMRTVTQGEGGVSMTSDWCSPLKPGEPMWFGGVRVGKAYVSYHLMPVYGCPDLVRDMPDELRRRMQGKSCFNFKSITPEQARMLRELTLDSYERFKRAGYIPPRQVAGTAGECVTSPTPGPSARSGEGCIRPTSTAPRGARPASTSRPKRR
jgi:hypothetical protein